MLSVHLQSAKFTRLWHILTNNHILNFVYNAPLRIDFYLCHKWTVGLRDTIYMWLQPHIIQRRIIANLIAYR